VLDLASGKGVVRLFFWVAVMFVLVFSWFRLEVLAYKDIMIFVFIVVWPGFIVL